MSAPTVRERSMLTAAAATHDGAMIALIPTEEDSARLAIDGYEPAKVLHTTLVFLGDAADWDNQSRDILEGAIRELETARAIRGDVWGHAQFNPNGDNPCAVYLVGAPGIENLQSAVMGAVEESADWFPEMPDQHKPWVPHITAGYRLPATQLTDDGPVTFDRIRLSFADEDIRDIMLTNLPERLVAAAESGHLPDLDMSKWPDRIVECQGPHTIPSTASTATSRSGGADHGLAASAETASTNANEKASPSPTSTAPTAPKSSSRSGDSGTKSDATDANSTVTEMRRTLARAKDELQTQGSANAETQPPKPGDEHQRADDANTPADGDNASADPNSKSNTSKPSSSNNTTAAQSANAQSNSTQGNSAPSTQPTSTTATKPKPSEDGSARHAIAASAHSSTTPTSSPKPSATSPNDARESNSPTYRSGIALTAGAAVPVLPPAEWFENPQLDGPTPLTVTPEGRVYGTLASWETCHVGFSNECVTPPRSNTDYAYYCNGVVLTEEGIEVRTGRITMGTGHAGLRMKPRVAAAHYDDTGTCVADVTAGEDPHGIWVAGAIRPGTSEEQLRALRASPLSGDWREVNGNLELVAALAVNVPGFPIPRPSTLAASGYRALTAAGVVPLNFERKPHDTNTSPLTPEDRRQVQFFSLAEFNAKVASEVRASRVRETASEKLAARVRATRVDAATRRVALVAAGAPKTDDQKAKPLERYWTKGEGLARWAESPTPYRTLVRELRKEIRADEMTDDQLHGLAANYYHAVKGEWPGKKNSDNGNRLALLTERMNALKLKGN